MAAHHHIIGTLAAITAAVALLSSPQTQKAITYYLKVIEKELVTAVHSLRKAAIDAGKTSYTIQEAKNARIVRVCRHSKIFGT